jgi:hypothetical protein
MYLNSPTMVAGLRSYLYATGVDVAHEMAAGSLILSSDQSHITNGLFDPVLMLEILEQAMSQALRDGYKGLWATGDMSWELGPDKDLDKLLEYEWRLEQFFHKHSTISGICQYHAETLPREIVCHGLLAHPALFINDTLARVNPHYIPSQARLPRAAPSSELKHTVHNLCALQPGDDTAA